MKILAFGEVMMRMMVPNNKLLSQSDQLEFLFVGTGVNILSGMKIFGDEVYLATTLPANNIGYSALTNIRKLGINDDFIKFQGNHIGIYFLESGFGDRPSEVTYLNRNMSSFGQSKVSDYNIEEMLEKVDAVHICGISLALNKNLRECAYELAKRANEKNKKVIFDFNFRPTLWNYDERQNAKMYYEEMLKYADIIFAGEKDACLLLEIPKSNESKYSGIMKMKELYNIEVIFGTERIKNEEGKLFLQGFMVKDKIYESKIYNLNILDRIGAGDAFAAGAIHKYFKNETNEIDIINFATCSGVISHTTYGDIPVVMKKYIDLLMSGKNIDLIR